MIYLCLVLIVAFILWNTTLWFYRPPKKGYEQIANAEPFDPRCHPITLIHNPPSKRAILMVHGFPSTPYTYDWAAKTTHAQGYDVFAPLLPGFGSDPNLLATSNFELWYAALRAEYLRLRQEYAQLYVVGTSLGGAMTLRLGEEFSQTPEEPTALVTIAAPVFLNSLRDWVFQDWRLYIARTIALFTPAFGMDIFSGKEEENDGDELWIGYKGSFVRPGLSIVHALKHIRANLGAITTPLMALHDRNDRTVPYKNLAVITQGVSSTHLISRSVEMEANHNRHILLMYRSVQAELLAEILTFFTTLEEQEERHEKA